MSVLNIPKKTCKNHNNTPQPPLCCKLCRYNCPWQTIGIFKNSFFVHCQYYCVS